MVCSEFWRLSSGQRHLVADSTVGLVARDSLAWQRLDPARWFAVGVEHVRIDHRPFAPLACSTRPAFSRRWSDDTVELRGRPFIPMISVERVARFRRISASGASSWGNSSAYPPMASKARQNAARGAR
jgi:hypothetical protein